MDFADLCPSAPHLLFIQSHSLISSLQRVPSYFLHFHFCFLIRPLLLCFFYCVLLIYRTVQGSCTILLLFLSYFRLVMEKLVNCQGKNSREDDVCCSLPLFLSSLGLWLVKDWRRSRERAFPNTLPSCSFK